VSALNKIAVIPLSVILFLTAFCITIKLSMGATNLTENSWVTKSPIPDGVSIVKTAVVNGKIYALTGSSTYEYDPEKDNWTKKTPMPTLRDSQNFGIAVCNNKIYVIGGSNNYGNNALSTNEAYDPATDTWATKNPMPTARKWLEANSVDGKIYVIGGLNYASRPYLIPATEVYDPVTDSWTIKQPAPICIIKGASAVVDMKIYILGGLGDNETLNAISNQVYDTENDTWSFGASLPTPMWYTAAGATTGTMAPKRIYVMGGGFDEVTDTMNVYNPEVNNWTTYSSLPTNRTGHSIAVVNDLLYVIGGGTGWHGGPPLTPGSGWTLTSKVEQYTPFGYGTVGRPDLEPFPTALVIAASGASIAIIGVGLLVYFRKRGRGHNK
jgi:N-acetylneuraminic acid mutarotase